MKKWIILLLALALSRAAYPAVTDTVEVFSHKMQRAIPTLVITPDHADTPLPVLYLLHGYSGSCYTWDYITDLRPLADRFGMILVCPSGENSWYWDSPTVASSQFETFVADELTAWTDANYRTIATREGRAVTGYSMGGHGALWVAMRHKDRFGAAGASSGGVDIRPFPDSWDMKVQLGERDRNPERWDAYTVATLAETLHNGELALILDCGYDDFFFEVNRQLHEKLLRQGVDHDYLTRPGEHDGSYWATALPYQMLFFQRYFEQHAQQSADARKGLRVVYMGDSITDGNWSKGDGEPCGVRNATDRNHIYGSGYMYLCASYYQGYYPERGYLFFNRGISGDSLDKLAERWQQDAIDTQPDVLSVFIGTNDVSYYLGRRAADPDTAPFDFDAWEQTYRRLLDRSLEANPSLKIVLCTPFAVRSGWVKQDPQYELRQQMLGKCSDAVARIASDYGAALVSFHELFGELQAPDGDDTYWVWDGIHPTAAGHRLMADLWIEAATRSGAMR